MKLMNSTRLLHIALGVLLCARFASADDTLPMIDTPEKAKAAQAAAAKELGQPTIWENTIGMKFALIPAGRFTMGSPGDEDAPPHVVTISKPFYMATTETTRAHWEKITGKVQSDFFPGEQMPINNIRWYDARTFVGKLSKLEEGNTYQLPTEAQWEYGARAGVTTDFPGGSDESNLDAVGWYLSNAGHATHPVAQKQSNAFGLYDMCGNVWEWCDDFYDPTYYKWGDRIDPTGPEKSLYGYRVLRSGSIYYQPRACRLGNRAYFQSSRTEKHIGFRVIRLIETKEAAQ